MAKREELGVRIRTMRRSRGMTQEDLAKAIGQSASSITMYETGRREPDLETIEALADVFNVSLFSLLDDYDKQYLKMQTISNGEDKSTSKQRYVTDAAPEHKHPRKLTDLEKTRVFQALALMSKTDVESATTIMQILVENDIL